MNEGLIHCGRCNRDVPTHEYSQHLLGHMRRKWNGEEYTSEGQPHEFGDSHCLATAHVYKGKNPLLKGIKKRERAAAKTAFEELQRKEEKKRKEAEKKRQETENREVARRAAQELSHAVTSGRSLGLPYSALTLNKGKTWKGRVHIIPGGSPGSKR